MLAIEMYARKESGAVQSTSMFNVLTKITIYTLAALVIMQTLGISILPLLTALGVGGLAVALALQDTLANLFAGLHIIATRKIAPRGLHRTGFRAIRNSSRHLLAKTPHSEHSPTTW